MRSKRVISVLLSMVFLFSAGSILLAQEEEQGNVFAMTFLKVQREDRDEYFKLWEREVLSIEKQIDEFLSLKVFTHWWGPDWNVVVIREFKDLASIEKAFEKEAELFKKKYPDEKEREEITKKLGKYLNGHFDAIVREVPKLRK